MEQTFITKIKVNKVRNLGQFEIPLSEAEMRHLIITGKNGSGKTTLLRELKEVLSHTTEAETTTYVAPKLWDLKASLTWENKTHLLSKYNRGNFIVAFFGSKRAMEIVRPDGVRKIEHIPFYAPEQVAIKDFEQYLVNLEVDRSFAKNDNDLPTVHKINDWFETFEKNVLGLIDSEVSLEFDKKAYGFVLVEKDKEPYNLNQLSDGYSSIFNIIAELIMRMREKRIKSYDVEGVVLIDEIEAHLHIDLQKKILPFLTSFFPKVQFIVTTHSPFVISSISNAVVYDLEKNILAEDLSGYSYDTVIESYFNADKYSSFLKEQVTEYERLVLSDDLNEAEKAKLFQLKQYLNEIPKFVSDELAVKLQQIKLKEMDRRVRV